MRASTFLVTLALSTSSATAAPQGTTRFARLSVDDGLSQSSVGHILQDRLGFLWFGTQEGLNRYDGYRFIVHRAHEEPGFLLDHNITALIEDRRGDLWIGTSRGLHRLELATGRIDREAGAAAGAIEVLHVVEDAAGRIWFATSGGALWVLEPGKGGAAAGTRVRSADLPAKAEVRGLARAGASSIWAAWSDGRLLRIEGGGAEPRVSEALRDLGTVTVLAADPGGRLWIGRREAELLRYDPSGGRVDRFPQAPPGALALLPAKTGGLWIGARAGGLSRLDPETGAVVNYRHDPDDPASLARDDVAALHEDRLGNLWIGAWNGGVCRLDPHAQAFRTFRRRPRAPDSLPDDDVTAMTETADGRLWLGSRNGVLAVGDPRAGRFGLATPERTPAVTALGADGSRVLVGTVQGLAALDPASGRRVPLPDAMRAAGLGERPITTIRTAPGGVLWIASAKSLFRWSTAGGPEAGLRRVEPPVESALSALFISPSGRLWVGSQTGELMVGEADGEGGPIAFRSFPIRATSARGSLVAQGFISSLFEDEAGVLWVGTRRGLGRIETRTGAASWLDHRSGLPSTNVAGLLGDPAGFLWVATNLGLTRIDPKTGATTHFGSAEGAQGTGYAERAYARGGSGHFYFAGRGVTTFDPRDVQLDPHRPEVVFTGLEILRRPVEPRWREPSSPLQNALHSTDAFTLDPTASVFSVEMAALHYSDPRSTRFTYRLDGFDPEWIEADALSRVATYTNLPPGDYRLRARARAKNGLWSAREATLAIRVLPPWWRTRNAIAGWTVLALLAAAVAVAEVRRRTRVRIALMERETLRRESLTDPLTGLYNRRFLATYLQHEVARTLREYEAKGPAAGDTGADLLFLLVDVDHFKAINDAHSHAAGDRVLVGIAEVLRDHIRDSDLAIRWGGDEFLVVSRSFHRPHAGASVDRLRRAVEDFGLELAARGGPACSVSIGYAAFPFLVDEPRALSWEQTLEIADHALLLTKQRRRNAHTGIAARSGVTSAAILEFLHGGRRGPVNEIADVVAPAAIER